MIRAFVVLAALISGVLPFAVSAAEAAAPPQTLRVTLHRNRAATERLPEYRTAAAISVRVGGDARRLPVLTLTARGPGGRAVTAPLARSGNTFAGDLRLTAPGAWTVAFSTQLGSVTAALASVPLDVVSEGSDDLAARIAFALSALLLIAGLALVLRVDGRPLAYALAGRS